jgi:hypothetical protein
MVIFCVHVFIVTFCPSDKLLCKILCCEFLSYMFCQNAKFKLWVFVLWLSVLHSTNTPITGVKIKRCSRLLLLRLINYFMFSIFKPSSNLFVLKKLIYIFFLIYVYKYLNNINTFTVRNYYMSWYRYLGKYLFDRFFLKPFLSF